MSTVSSSGAGTNSLTAQDYQICITVIEARHLAGINMDPVVCVQVRHELLNKSQMQIDETAKINVIRYGGLECFICRNNE